GDVPLDQQVEHDDRHVVVHAQRERRGVGHLQALLQRFGVRDGGVHGGIGVLAWVGGVDPVHRLGHQHDLAADFQRPLCSRGVGGEVRQTRTATEDHDAALLQVPFGAARNVGFGDLTHRDGGLHPGRDAFLLQKVLQRQAVHHGAEHAHVVGPVPVHAALLQLGATEEVPAADHDRYLDAAAYHLGDLHGDGVHHVRVHADRPAAEHLATEFEQHSAIAPRARPPSVSAPAASWCIWAAARGLGTRHNRYSRSLPPRRQAWPTSNRTNRLTATPAASSSCFTVFLLSVTDGCSSSTLSLKQALTLPSTILGSARSGLPSSMAVFSAIAFSFSTTSAGTSSRV